MPGATRQLCLLELLVALVFWNWGQLVPAEGCLQAARGWDTALLLFLVLGTSLLEVV